MAIGRFSSTIVEVLTVLTGPTLLLLLLSFNSVNGQPETYDSILKTLKHPEKLIFDINITTAASITGQDVILKSEKVFLHNIQENVVLSPKLYYALSSTPSKSKNLRNNKNQSLLRAFLQNDLFPEPNSIYVIKDSNGSPNEFLPLTPESLEEHLQQQQLEENFQLQNKPTITVSFKVNLFNFYYTAGSLNESIRILSAFKSTFKNTKISLEYDAYGSERLLLPIVELVDAVVVHVDLYYSDFGLTFTQFNSTLHNLMSGKVEFIRKTNSACKIILKIKFPEGSYEKYKNEPNGPRGLYQRYFHFLLQFSIFWINSGAAAGKYEIILPSFTRKEGNTEWFSKSGSHLRKIVTPYIQEENRLMDSGNDCKLAGLLNLVSNSFDTVLVDSSKFLPRIGNAIKCEFLKPQQLPQLYFDYQFPVSHDGHGLSNFSSLVGHLIADVNEKLPLEISWKFLNVMPTELADSDHNIRSLSLDDLPIKAKTLLPNITLSCNYLSGILASARSSYFDDIFGYIEDDCQFMWNQTTSITWNLAYNTETSLNDLLDSLIRNRLMRNTFMNEYQNKTVWVWVQLSLNRDYRKVQPNNLYCDEEILAFNERAEIIVNFARANNFPIGFKQIVTEGDEIGWWSLLRTDDAIKTASEMVPLFVARNYPVYQAIKDEDFHTEPCLVFTERLIKEKRISFEDSKYSGTTLYIEKKKDGTFFTIKELKIMLMFAIHKFSMIELVPKSFEDLELVKKVLSQKDFVEVLKKYERNVKKLKLYLVLDALHLEKIMLSKKIFIFVQDFSKLALKLEGIHFQNWEETFSISPSKNQTLSLMRFFNNYGLKVGLSLDNCTEHVNSFFENLKSLKLNNFQVDYLLCNLPQIQELNNHNKVEMEKLLDTSLYIKKFYKQIFLNDTTEIFFRMNPIQKNYNNIMINERDFYENALKFLNDVNQYANLNKMNFFMLPTFDNEEMTRFGWWKIQNYRTLTNTSVFIEKESYYYNKTKTWRPAPELLLLLTATSSKAFSGILPTAALVVSNIVLAGCVILILTIWYRRRSRFLTEDEVKEFLMGREGDKFVDGDVYENLKFPEEYEIRKSKFILLNILGSGYYGLVYKAQLNFNESDDEDEKATIESVAVKIPRPNCTKETFKSMLSELKILSYVGSHPHVLRFIGAHTKAIQRGEVYIATELCENGALQDYLRKLENLIIPLSSSELEINEAEDKSKSLVNLYELYRFSQEISSGMEYISKKAICHGDLSTRNVLLDSNLSCKIGDFGLSKKMYESKSNKENDKECQESLPWRWMALETLKRMEFTTKADVWSFGITLWEIFSLGNVPYANHQWNQGFLEELDKGMRMPAPKFANDIIYEKMSSCWNTNPEERPTFADLADYFATLRNFEYSRIDMIL